MANNLLYPPILFDSAPAFVGKSFTITFELSPFNSIDDINKNAVQVTVIKQSTNTSILKAVSGIKMANLNIDESGKYYITITENDLLQNSFEKNQFYKVQIRLTSKDLFYNDKTEIGASWFYANRGYFSQWSKVCLIKNISKPTLYIDGLVDENQKTTFNTSMFSISGYLNFDKDDKEYLKSYHIKIYPIEDSSNLIVDTGEIYTNINNPNNFYYQINEELLDSIDYIMQFTYITNNSYTETKKYNFIIIEYGFDKLNVSLTAFPDQENGRVIIQITPINEQDFIGNVTIRRTSSKSDFHKWEDLKNFTFLESRPLEFSFSDNTIESGIWYKYGIQKRNIFGDRGIITQLQEPVICIFQHIFLSTEERQLKIQFNPSLNEFKYNVNEIQQNTIGSKYPYIKRNGANYFRSFPIGGLITALSDMTDWYDPHFIINNNFDNTQNELKLFTSKEEVYSSSLNLYENYNFNNRINEYNDSIYERKFREKVYDFLYQHNVKLFRSTTEGNILIKLMNIDFQPVEALGRRLYSFTATAIEIDEANIKNYDKYNIQSIGEYQTHLTHKEKVFGQIYKNFTNSMNIMNQINNKYKNSATKGFENIVTSLSWVKIEIESEPYIIIEQNGRLRKGQAEEENIPNAIYGYIANINGNEIIIYPQMERRVTFFPINIPTTKKEINKNINENNFIKNTDIIYLGKFELKNNVEITSFNFKYNTTATVTYIANLEEKISNNSNSVKNYYYSKKIGQIYGVIPLNQNLIRQIYNKYIQKYEDYYQQLLEVKSIEIEAPQGTVCYIKDSKDTDFNKHIIENGFLRLKDDDTSISKFYFQGIQLKETSKKEYLRKDQYYIENISESYKKIIDIKNPKPNHVYTIDAGEFYIDGTEEESNILTINPDSIEYVPNYYRLILNSIENSKQQYIYYNNKWYPFNNGIVLCPIQGIITYCCDVVKGEYR